MAEKQEQSGDFPARRKEHDHASPLGGPDRDVDSTLTLDEALNEAKRQYDDLFNLAADGVVIHELAGSPAAGNFMRANPAICDLLGYTAEEMRALTPLDVTAAEDHHVVASDAETLACHVVLRHEKTLIAKDGRRIPVEMNSRIFQDRGRRMVMSVIRDVTERKRAEEALRESQSLFQALIEGVSDPVYVKDQESRLLFGNQALARVAGKPLGEIIGKTDSEYYGDPEVGQALREHDLTVMQSGTNETVEEAVPTPEGCRVFLSSKAPYRDPSGDIVGIVGISQDISERKKAEEELLRARAEAERRAAELESFISSMTEGVVMTDADGNTVYANEAAMRILGDDPAKSVQDRLEQYGVCWMDGSPMKAEETPTCRALRGETVSGVNYRLTSVSGKDTVISMSASPVRGSEGSVLGAATVFQDITDRADFDRQREALYQREHHIAEMLQEALVPSSHCDMPRMDVAVRYEPALEEATVGGDFYDIFDLEDGKFGILLGDVAGKGLSAAIRVAAARHSVRSYAYLDPRPSRVMTLANEALCRDQQDGIRMVTVFFAVVDTNLGTIAYANGGHEPPILLRADGSIEELNVEGRALGVYPAFEYPQNGRVLQPGDTVAMVTDGITEARPDPESLFGLEGVVHYLSSTTEVRSPNVIADGLLAAAKDHAGGSLTDDAAIVVLTFCGKT
jgi:PAS domain S-box-containing protein